MSIKLIYDLISYRFDINRMSATKSDLSSQLAR